MKRAVEFLLGASLLFGGIGLAEVQGRPEEMNSPPPKVLVIFL
jgi:hypothetical protein